MGKFVTGNVIRTKYNSIEIVTNVDNGLTHTISFDATNCSSVHREKTETFRETCDCGECRECEHEKVYERVVYGMEDATLVARTVKDWILNSVTSGFNFKQ